jgi:hypothetical protein
MMAVLGNNILEIIFEKKVNFLPVTLSEIKILVENSCYSPSL